MKEIEYIKATDLAKVRMARTILTDVLTTINDEIPEDEYQTVMLYLSEWQNRLFTCKDTEIQD